jgi:hypothetical protein
MALRARRPGATAGASQTEGTTQAQEQDEAPATQQTSVPAGNVDQHVPATRQPSAPPASTGQISKVAEVNAGVLEGFEDLSGGGNYVTVDGTEFLYKDTNETAKEIEMVISAGKRYYQWVDESDPDNKVFHDSPTKLDNRYRLKAEIRWFEENEEGEQTEYILNMGTTSAIQFINYVQALAKQGKGVGSVVTKATISRQQRKGTTDRYSRVDFTMLGDAE